VRTLLETTIPVDVINAACEQDKNIKTGHIRSIHKWFAPMPLPAWRGLLYAALIPYSDTTVDRHFKILEGLVSDRGPALKRALTEAKEEIAKAWGTEAPTIVDPFCGGGSTIVEAQRLGLSTLAADLNPIPVLITTALTSFIQRFKGRIKSRVDGHLTDAADIIFSDFRFYGEQVEALARKKVGHLYPECSLKGGGSATITSAIWARTVPSPSPALGGMSVPLIKSMWLSKANRNPAWVDIVPVQNGYRFVVRSTGSPTIKGTMEPGGARCFISGVPIPFKYIREQAKSGKLGLRLIAMQAMAGDERVYLDPDWEFESLCFQDDSETKTPLPPAALGFRIQEYGQEYYEDMFTPRQLVMLNAFAEEVASVVEVAQLCDRVTFVQQDERPLTKGGAGRRAYADGIGILLSLALGKVVQSNNMCIRWYIDARNGSGQPLPAFDRQTIQMSWDFAEVNPFGGSIGSWGNQITSIVRAFGGVDLESPPSVVVNKDARATASQNTDYTMLATDPPYYDNIGYSDLSNVFYIWMRTALKSRLPELFATIKAPQDGELIADPARHASKDAAKLFFQEGFSDFIKGYAGRQNKDIPFIVIYAYKQQEEAPDAAFSTGWEVILQALYEAEVAVVGTWPISSNRSKRMRAIGSNALASSLALVCRYAAQSGTVTRGDFVRSLRQELPPAIALLKRSSIAPVDLTQAAIGPGMAIFTRYSKVLKADDTPMSVKEALQEINVALDVALSDQEADYDPYTRFAITWFEQVGMTAGAYGTAETLATARGISVAGVRDAGIVESGASKVRLKRRDEAVSGSNRADTVWASTQYLIHRLMDGSEEQAAEVLARLGARAEAAKDLAYRLYGICGRKKWADEGYPYNALVASWPRLVEQAKNFTVGPAQGRLGL
jgi:putative DNA methylase